MKLSDTSMGKVLAAVSKHGLRAGLGYAAARWAQVQLSVPYDVARDYAWILNQDNPATLPAPQTGPLKINWLIPGLVGGSGGQLNIFRTIHYLEQWGHENRVYAIARNTPAGAAAQRLLRDFYFPIKAPIEIFDGKVADSDALVATEWTTAYVARALSNTAGKFYFVQDLEDRFYADGSLAEFARETYRWHYHGLTLGYWIAEVLQDEFDMPCSPFGFSFDRGIYSSDRQESARRQNRVLFYARPASERRGFELGILALSLVAKQRPDVEFVLVGFRPRSMRIPFHGVFPGVLPPSELAKLYRSCEVALVLSHTNLSMLPLELMACGCAVVSNRGRNVEWLLTDEIAQLANATPESLAEAILRILNNEELRSRKVAAGLAFAQRTDWVSETRLVEKGIFQGLKTADGSTARPLDGAVVA